ncbi:MAG TPA: hypothetical protein VLG13_02025 [Patescibacteria group bacterium]|nr:hypothetical protein [Patescibacteria group bacterium]
MNKQEPHTNRQTSRRFVFGVLLVGALAALAIFCEHQAVYDWLRLHGYQAPSDSAQLASDDTFTGTAKHIYYVNHPLLKSKADFAKACPGGNKETAVLGCYVPDQRGIFVLSVTDVRLAGIEQVTAAHEMLHAAYDRLSSRDKAQVDGWLMDYYQHDLNDQTIIDQMDSYKKTEPNDLVNEMHSVFGTEVVGLPANLENYYHRYFANRSKVATYYSTYEAEFSSRQAAIKQDDAELASLKEQVQAGEADLKTKQAALGTMQSRLVTERSSGNVAAYNAGVPAYNALVDSYNAEVATVRQLVSQYNQLVAARNAIVLEEQQLVQDISSQAAPISQ